MLSQLCVFALAGESVNLCDVAIMESW